MTFQGSERRRFTRFEPDPLTYAQIDLKLNKEDYNPKHIGMIIEEGQKGCGLVVSSKTGLKKGDRCLLKVGELPLFTSEVRWVIRLDKDLLKIGFEYLE